MGPSANKPMISDKEVTGFTTKGEEQGVLDANKNWKWPTIEAAAKDVGATCKTEIFTF